MSVELNIFTNCAVETPSTKVIRTAYLSFVSTFGYIDTTIYLDPMPYPEKYIKYRTNLKRLGFRVVRTKGLADGYVKSIKSSKSDYLFQLEYDFKLHDVNHSLYEITQLMKERGAYHFRFNRRFDTPDRIPDKWHSYAVEKEQNGIKFLVCDNLSNNPHLIERQFYLDHMIHKIDTTKGRSFGIEENLTRKGYKSYVYGGWECVTATHMTPMTKKTY